MAHHVLAVHCEESYKSNCIYLIEKMGDGADFAYFLPKDLPNPFVKMKDNSYAPVGK